MRVKLPEDGVQGKLLSITSNSFSRSLKEIDLLMVVTFCLMNHCRSLLKGCRMEGSFKFAID